MQLCGSPSYYPTLQDTHAHYPDHYALSFPRDNRTIKVTVYGVFVLDTLQSITIASMCWYLLCSGWGRPAALLELNWTFCTIPAVTGVGERPYKVANVNEGTNDATSLTVSAWVQGFYAWRIYKIGQWRALPLFIIAIALMQCAGALSITVGVSSLSAVCYPVQTYTAVTDTAC
jgi:hypothetical protein